MKGFEDAIPLALDETKLEATDQCSNLRLCP
jgi:hypothetical protein